MGARAASSILALLFLWAASPVAAHSQEYRLAAAPRWAESGALAEPLGADDYIALAVDASTSDPRGGALSPGAAASAQSMREFVNAEADGLKAIDSQYERAAQALSVLHRKKLKLYRTEQTRVDLAMEGGVYNCVSSAIAYIALAKACGLEAQGVQTDDHAFATVKTERGAVDVETTNAAGFDPGNHKEAFTDSFGKVTGYAYVPPEQYAKRRSVGDRAFIGLILHNRISSLEAARDFGSGLSLAADYYALDARAETRAFLMERGRNLAATLIDSGRDSDALDLLDKLEAAFGADRMIQDARAVALQNSLAAFGDSGKYEEGLAFIDQARKRWGEQPAFSSFQSMALNNRSIDLVNAGKFREALAFLKESLDAGRALPQECASLRANVALAWIDRDIERGDFPSSLALIRELSGQGDVSGANLAAALLKACGTEANRQARADPALGWFLASQAFDQGLAILPGDADLLKNRASCLGNYATATYNRFVSAYNAGNAAEARAILEDGLSRFPGSALLSRQLAELKAK